MKKFLALVFAVLMLLTACSKVPEEPEIPEKEPAKVIGNHAGYVNLENVSFSYVKEKNRKEKQNERNSKF